MEPIDNKVSFLVNKSLIDLMIELQLANLDILEESITANTERDFELMIKNQDILRQYIIDRQDRIEFTKKIKLKVGTTESMPELYGLGMLMVCDLTKITCVDDILIQYENIDEAPLFDEGGDGRSPCVCGHQCNNNNMWRITNKINNNTIILGCHCITKNEIQGSDAIISYNNKREVKRKDSKDIDNLINNIDFEIPNIRTERIDRIMSLLNERRGKCISRVNKLLFIKNINTIFNNKYVASNIIFATKLKQFIVNTRIPRKK